MPVVDAHAHLGKCRVFDLEVSAENLLAAMDANGIDATIVMPFPGAEDARRTHDAIAELAERYKGRIFGMVNLNPHCGPEEYFAEANRCVKELGFVGLKLHTVGHAVNPLSRDAETVFLAARELGVPVMIHSGPGVPFALPAHLLPRAKEFPDVKFVIAHAGFTFFTGEAYAVAQECSNIYLETSWLFSDDIRWLVKTFGAERVMMGADLPRNVAPALTIAESADLSEEEKRLYLGETAVRTFKLNL